MEDKYIGGIKKETHNLIYNDENLTEPYINSELNNQILDEISLFTRMNDKSIIDRIRMKILSIRYSNIDFKKISYDKKRKVYAYNYNGNEIIFRKLSDIIDNKDLRKELMSRKRFGKCHERSINLLTTFKQPTTERTGTWQKHDKVHLHSIIELQGRKGKQYIVDYNLNLIMEKQQYLELTKFKEIESIKETDLLEDMRDGTSEFLEKTNFMFRPYVIFRQEIKSDLKRNESLLNKTDDEKLNKQIFELQKQREEFEKE